MLGISGMWQEVIPALLGNPGPAWVLFKHNHISPLSRATGASTSQPSRGHGDISQSPTALWMARNKVPKTLFGSRSQSSSRSLAFLASGYCWNRSVPAPAAFPVLQRSRSPAWDLSPAEAGLWKLLLGKGWDLSCPGVKFSARPRCRLQKLGSFNSKTLLFRG